VGPVVFPRGLFAGPTDDRITTAIPGTDPVARNSDGDFLFEPGTDEFDCAHTFAVARMTLDMFDQHNGSPVGFAWGRDRVTLFPHASLPANALYSRESRVLAFGTLRSAYSDGRVYTCRSADVVAHETAHAVLDGLQPGWLASGDPQTAALHESFADMAAIFLSLSQSAVVDAVLADCGGDLYAGSFLSSVAKEFGDGLGRACGLRNADNDLTLSDVSDEPHELSQVFTGALYDALLTLWSEPHDLERGTSARSLMTASARLCRLLLGAVKAAPAEGAGYADVARLMLSAPSNPKYQDTLRGHFVDREILT
jgi:hypothetical protein